MRIKLFSDFNEKFSDAPVPIVREERLISFTRNAFQEFNEWKQTDKFLQDKIIKLIEDTIRDPFRGLGKPEQLKGRGKSNGHLNKSSWSRRISDEHRLVYEVSGTDIKITSCKGHYDD